MVSSKHSIDFTAFILYFEIAKVIKKFLHQTGSSFSFSVPFVIGVVKVTRKDNPLENPRKVMPKL